MILLLLLMKRYNLYKVLACSTTLLQLSLFCATFFQSHTFILFISSKTSSSYILGLLIRLLDMGFHLSIGGMVCKIERNGDRLLRRPMLTQGCSAVRKEGIGGMIWTGETVIFREGTSGRLLPKWYKEFFDQLRKSLFLKTGYSMELLRLRHATNTHIFYHEH